MIFFHGIDSRTGSALELSANWLFSLDKYRSKMWVENSVFATQHIGNRKSVFEVLYPFEQAKL